jgi:AcrR family transcriptional regulator
MPPKVKITKKDIIETTLSLVREGGAEAINARGIANALNCSTQPIFSNFESMEELERLVFSAAYENYLGFIASELKSEKYPPYKAYGMAYIRFAKEEKELFKLLFMCDRQGEELAPSSDFESAVEMIMKTNGCSREVANLMHLEMWACVHGIATMMATSFLELDFELVSRMVTDVYQGLRTRLLDGGNADGCN